MLSVIHHIDGVSDEMYANAGLSKVEGIVDLVAKLLSLAPSHFIELPYKPWLAAAFEAFHSARGILEAASKRSQYSWNFVGPLHSCDWFGPREVWLLQVKKGEMLPIDLAANPFHQLISDVDLDNELEDPMPAADASVLGAPRVQDLNRRAVAGGGDQFLGGLPGQLGRSNDLNFDMALGPLGGVFANDALGNLSSSKHYGGNLLIDPAITALCAERPSHVEDQIGEFLQKSPTPLLVAHLVLREAINEAQDMLQQIQSATNSVVAQSAPQRTLVRA